MNWLEKYSDDVPKAQNGRATRADSLAVLNSQLALNKFYNKEIKAGRLKKKELDFRGYKGFQPTSKDINKLNKDNLEFYRTEIKDRQENKKGLYDDQYKKFFKLTPNQVSNLEYKGLGNTKGSNKNKALYRDIITPQQNLAAPMALIDSRIAPQGSVEYQTVDAISRYPGGMVSVYDYDPLAVKPFNMLTDAEKKLRVKKYGTNGVPKSYLNTIKDKLNKDPKPEQKPNLNKKLKLNPKPKQEIVQPDLPRVENVNLPPMQQMEQSAIVPIGNVREPKSYNVNMQRYNMEGPSKYYNADEQNIDYNKVIQIKNASDAYNKNIEKRYGPQNEYRNTRSAEKAAERFKQLRSESEITPNYRNGGQSTHDGLTTEGFNYNGAWGGQFQMGGDVYPVNYVPEAQMGTSIPGAVGFSYARTQSPAPSNGKYAKKTMASAQDGKTFPEFKKIVAKSQEEKLRESLKERPRESVRENTAVVNRINGKQKTVNPNQQMSTKYNAVKEAKQKKEETNAMLADRKARIEDSILAQDEDIIGNPNWREVLARETQATGDKFRLFPEEDSFFDNYLNPGVMIGNMASGLGQAPYRAEQTDSYMPYVTSIGMPLAVGALGGLGANSNTQFVNNLVNPVAGLNIRRGLNNFTNELVSHARSLGPNRRVVTNSFGNEQVGDLVQRLRSNQPLGEMQIGSLGQAYNSGSLSRADSELFTRYLIDRNRVTPSPPGGLFGMTAEETAEQYARMQENPMGWKTERWNVNNQLAPPPSEIRFNIDGSTESIYSARPQPTIPTTLNGIDLRRPINGHAPGTPEWERLNNQIWELQNMTKPTLRNKSGYTKEDLLNQASSKDKEVISKMTEKEFQETVFTPKGEVLNYKPNAEIDQMAYNPVTGGSALKDQIPLSNEEYAKVFNENIDVLNDIISKNNTSGVNYSVSELTPSGQLIFNTPAQKVAANRSFVDIMRTPVDEFRNVVRNEMDLPAGQSSWTVNIKPGQWRGEVENIANPEYYKSIPGLDMSNTSRSVFADNVPRRGTGTYESINEYLKRLDLGRVKPGFNSQTQFSKGLWENAIKKDKAFGFYGNPGTVYGSMKSIAPYLGIGGVGAAAASQTEEEVVPGMKQGGVIKDDMGQWAHPGEITEIGSNQITMQGVPYDVLGISDEGDTKLMKPGKNYRFKGKKVTEFPMAKNGLRQEQKGLVNLDQLTNFTNYNTKQPGGWMDKYQ